MKQPPADDNITDEAIHLGNTEFFYSLNELRNGTERVIITSRQAEILKLLTDTPNEVVPRETILKQVWGDDSYANSLALNVQITYLRRALKSDERLCIEAIMEETLRENNKFIRTMLNQQNWQKVNSEINLQFGPIKDILNFNFTGGMSYFDSKGTDYHHTYTNWYYRAGASLVYKNFISSFEIYSHQNDFYGETLTYGENLHMEVCVTNFGGRIVSILVPDKTGKMQDVVLGFDNIKDYINIPSDFGASIGRYANRINKGKFVLDGKTYQLPQNNYGHCLHGGPKGFQYQVYDADQIDAQTLQLTYKSKDEEEGFPGDITCKVTMKLTDDNAIDINYEATTDKPTVVNMTNHSYFNLDGDAQSNAQHLLTIHAISLQVRNLAMKIR